MPLKSKPIYIVKPFEEMRKGCGFIPYFYEEELRDVNS